MKILDNYETKGSGKAELYKALDDLSGITRMVNTRSDCLEMITVVKVDENGLANCFVRKKLDKEGFLCDKTIEIIDLSGYPDELVEEVKTVNPLLIRINGKLYFTSDSIWATLSQRAGTHVDKNTRLLHWQARDGRDQNYLAYLIAFPKDLVILYREENEIRKAFAAFASYGYVNQSEVIKKLVSEMEADNVGDSGIRLGECEVSFFEVNNMHTKCMFEFPEKRDDFSKSYNLAETVTPGIEFYTSDVGESSVFVRGFFKVGKHERVFPEGFAISPKKHTKNCSAKGVIDECVQKIFSEYAILPEKMVTMVSEDILTPYVTMEKVLSKIGFMSIFGKKKFEGIRNQMQAAIGQTPCTAYDIFSVLLDFSDEVSEEYAENSKTIRQVQEAVMKVPYLDWGVL